MNLHDRAIFAVNIPIPLFTWPPSILQIGLKVMSFGYVNPKAKVPGAVSICVRACNVYMWNIVIQFCLSR